MSGKTRESVEGGMRLATLILGTGAVLYFGPKAFKKMSEFSQVSYLVNKTRDIASGDGKMSPSEDEDLIRNLGFEGEVGERRRVYFEIMNKDKINLTIGDELLDVHGAINNPVYLGSVTADQLRDYIGNR